MAVSPWDVVVVGAGAAGLLAAIRAAELARRTLLVEKNRRPGVKILMSGGTRCNLTHATDNRGIVEAFGPPGRFLHSSLAALSVQDTIDLFESEGVSTKVEATGKVFPVSNKAGDVLAALLRRLGRSGATLTRGEPVRDLRWVDVGASGTFALTTPQRVLSARRVVLTTGGQSYPGSGTTGDGYGISAGFGHTIVAPRPALVPLQVDAAWAGSLRGVSLPDVALRVLEGERVLAHARGSMLFAHFGLTGPVVLDISRAVTRHARPASLRLECDLLPEQAELELDAWLRAESAAWGRKHLAGLLAARLPHRLCDVLVTLAGMPADRRAAALSRRERAELVLVLKQLRLPIVGALGFEKAEVTSGGLALDEIDSRSMESKRRPGLYLAGEILDLDGPIGGYNFQAAFSTGWLAGTAAARP